jgi:hypothetical protein
MTLDISRYFLWGLLGDVAVLAAEDGSGIADPGKDG